MTKEERIERLEKIVALLCEHVIEANLDDSWRKPYDALHEFIKEMKE